MGRRVARSHDGMVQHAARHLKQRFYQDVRARTLGFPEPEGVGGEGGSGSGCLPDITMIARGSEFHVLEVETPETLEERRTQERWRLLASHARQRGGSLWVVVPAGCRDRAEGRLRSLDLEARIWEL